MSEEQSKTSCECGDEHRLKKKGLTFDVKKFLIFSAVLLLLIGFASLFVTIHIEDPANVPPMPVWTVELERSDLKTFPVEVEVASTLLQQSRGLQNRTDLPQGKGMLFTYKTPQVVRFWMKDTLIPLDMLFILPDGTIYKIVQGAKPKDETPIPSEALVIAVLELKGGEVKRMGLEVGDSISLVKTASND